MAFDATPPTLRVISPGESPERLSLPNGIEGRLAGAPHAMSALRLRPPVNHRRFCRDDTRAGRYGLGQTASARQYPPGIYQLAVPSMWVPSRDK